MKNPYYYTDIQATNNEIQLLYLNFCRLFSFQIRYYSISDEQQYLEILSKFLYKFPNNALFINEILQRIDKNTLRINRIPKLKELIHCKYLNLSIWLLLLHKVNGVY